MPAEPAATARGRERRERLLHATAELAAERGFHAVGIADIGAAAGVTGAAIYRHFRTKTELLVAVFDRVVDELRERAVAALAAPEPLDALIRAHVEFAVRDRAVIAVYNQESHHLPAGDLRRLRRKQRDYVEQWVSALHAVRPQLPVEAARVRVHATFGLLNSVADFPGRLPDQQLAGVLTAMATAALLSG